MNHGRFNVSIRELKGVPPLTGDTSAYPTPSAFGRFQVLHQIGAGVLGPVFLARDAERKSHAIKVFRLDITPEQASELASQLAALSRTNLGHPSIAAPLSAAVEGSTPYLVQEYVGADSLDAAIRQYGPAPLPQALRILTSVAGALDFAAAVGVFHGSLHPRDLLVTQDDVRVTGIGIGGALESIGLRGPIRRPYTAPERVQRESWDSRADVYSVGMLARELIVGPARQLDAPGGRIAGEQAARVEEIVARATAARSVDRHANALELVRALQDALSTGVPAVSRHTARAAVRPERSRRGAADLLLPLDEDVAEPPRDPDRPEQDSAVHRLGVAKADLDVAEADALVDEAGDARALPAEEVAAGIAAAANEGDRGEGALDTLPPVSVDIEPELASFAGTDPKADFTIPEVPGPMADLTLREPVDELAEVAQRFESPLDVTSLDEDLTGARQPMSLALDEAGQGLMEPPAAETRPARADADPRMAFEPVDTSEPSAFGEPLGPPVDRDRLAPSYRQAALPPPERTSRLLPLGAVLLLGLAIGVLIGYLWGSSGTPVPTTAPASQQASAPAGVTPDAAAANVGTPAASPRSTPPPAAAAADPAARPPSASTTRAPAAPAKANGRLTIRSTPRGASVSVNGRARGVTPLRLSNLPVGRYTVRVSRRGYATEERDVALSSERPASTLTFSLTRGSRAERTSTTSFTGTLAVDSMPSGAKVFVDGKLLGTTPCVLTGVSAASHVVRVDLVGFKRWAQAVQVRSGGRVRVTASLERESQ